MASAALARAPTKNCRPLPLRRHSFACTAAATPCPKPLQSRPDRATRELQGIGTAIAK